MSVIVKKKQNTFKKTILNKKDCLISLDKLLITANIPKLKSKFGGTEEKKIYPAISSLESFPLTKLQNLKATLTFILSGVTPISLNNTIELSETNVERYKRMLSVINNILNSEYYQFYLEEGILYRSMVYSYVSGEKLGRLYSVGTSIQKIPKKYRSFLFENIYQDVDLVNAHPSILMEYSEKMGLTTTTLKLLIENRESFYARVMTQELGCENVKKEVISCLNKTKYEGNSILLKTLFKEILLIRESIWNTFYLKDEKVFNTIKARKSFNSYSTAKQLVTVQSIFCQTEETRYLLELYDLLLLEVNSNKEELHFIPFFDGALIKMKNILKHNKLQTFINVFNSKYKYIAFKIKPFEEHLNKDELTLITKISVIENALKKSNRTNILKLLEDTSSTNLISNEIVFKKKDIDTLVLESKKTQNEYYNIQSLINEKIQEKKEKKSIIKKFKNGHESVQLRSEIDELEKELQELYLKGRQLKYHQISDQVKEKLKNSVNNFQLLCFNRLIKHANSAEELANYLKSFEKTD